MSDKLLEKIRGELQKVQGDIADLETTIKQNLQNIYLDVDDIKLCYFVVLPYKFKNINDNIFKHLISLSKKADFPILASNLLYKDVKKNKLGLDKKQFKRFPFVFDPYKIIQVNDINVGILGIIPSKLNEFVLQNNIMDLELVSEINALEKWVPIIKSKRADIIILLSSLGVPWNREKVFNEFIYNFKQMNNSSIYKCNNSLKFKIQYKFCMNI